MVWKTTQSAFYRAVDSFNNGEQKVGDRDGLCREKHDNKIDDHYPEDPPEKGRENHRRNGEKHRSNDRDSCGCPHCRVCRRQPEPLSRLLSDKDMLLIAGLILVLSKQNADQKLILALAFVLLT